MSFSLFAPAQDTPRVEIFTGYSLDYAGFPVQNGTDNLGNAHGILNGWNASANLNLNRWIGVVADFGGHYGQAQGSKELNIVPPNCFIGCIGPVTVTLHSVQTYTFGPEIANRSKDLTLFARALFGAAHTREDIDSFATSLTPNIRETKFAMILDGGVDINFKSWIALRIQPGYLMTHMLDRRQSGFRFSTGPVFSFGR